MKRIVEVGFELRMSRSAGLASPARLLSSLSCNQGSAGFVGGHRDPWRSVDDQKGVREASIGSQKRRVSYNTTKESLDQNRDFESGYY